MTVLVKQFLAVTFLLKKLIFLLILANDHRFILSFYFGSYPSMLTDMITPPITLTGTPVSSRALTNLGEKYREGLLDGEVSIYTCRAAAAVSGDCVREITDPVCNSLMYGDDMVS